jgi:hypothetical protein
MKMERVGPGWWRVAVRSSPWLVGVGQGWLWTPVEVVGWGLYLLALGDVRGAPLRSGWMWQVAGWSGVGALLSATTAPVIFRNAPDLRSACGLWVGLWAVWTLSLLCPVVAGGLGRHPVGVLAGWAGVALGGWARYMALGYHWTGVAFWTWSDVMWGGLPLALWLGAVTERAGTGMSEVKSAGHPDGCVDPGTPGVGYPARSVRYVLGLMLMIGLVPDGEPGGGWWAMGKAADPLEGGCRWLVVMESRGEGASPPEWSPGLRRRLRVELSDALWWARHLTGAGGVSSGCAVVVTPEWGTVVPEELVEELGPGWLLSPMYTAGKGEIAVWMTWSGGEGGVAGRRLKHDLTPVGERPCWGVQTWPVRYRKGDVPPPVVSSPKVSVLPLLCVEALDHARWREPVELLTVSGNWSRLTYGEKERFRNIIARLCRRYGKRALLSVHEGEGGFWTPAGEQPPVYVSRPVRDGEQPVVVRLLVYREGG